MLNHMATNNYNHRAMTHIDTRTVTKKGTEILVECAIGKLEYAQNFSSFPCILSLEQAEIVNASFLLQFHLTKVVPGCEHDLGKFILYLT